MVPSGSASAEGTPQRGHLNIYSILILQLLAITDFPKKVGIGLPLMEEFSIGSQLSLRFGVL